MYRFRLVLILKFIVVGYTFIISYLLPFPIEEIIIIIVQVACLPNNGFHASVNCFIMK